MKKENNFYEEMRKIGYNLSSRKTLSVQLMREYELSQIGLTSKSGATELIEYQEKKGI